MNWQNTWRSALKKALSKLELQLNSGEETVLSHEKILAWDQKWDMKQQVCRQRNGQRHLWRKMES